MVFQARNKDQEKEILDWIEAVTGEKLPNAPYEDVLKDGIVLCNLINKIAPGSVNKIQTKGTNFQLMENVQRYTWHGKREACSAARGWLCSVPTEVYAKWRSEGSRCMTSGCADSRRLSANMASLTRRSSRRLTCLSGGTSLK